MTTQDTNKTNALTGEAARAFRYAAAVRDTVRDLRALAVDMGAIHPDPDPGDGITLPQLPDAMRAAYEAVCAARDEADARFASLLAALARSADRAGVTNAGSLSPDRLIDALDTRIGFLLDKAGLYDRARADALRTIGYDDTEIQQCLHDVPDLTMSDIDHARTFAEGWTDGKTSYSGSKDINDTALRVMPRVDYSNATLLSNLFQNATALEYIPALDFPKAKTINYMFFGLRKLHRIPQVNAPEADSIPCLYSTCLSGSDNSVEALPSVISHPKATNIMNLFNGSSAQALAGLPDLALDFGIITNAALMFANSGAATFHATEFTSDGVRLEHAYWQCGNITGDKSHIRWNVPHVTNLEGTFYAVPATAIDVSGIHTAGCKSFSLCFASAGCEYLDLSTWDISGADTVEYMFTHADSLRQLDFSNKKIKDGCAITGLFTFMDKLKALDISNLDLTGMAPQNASDAIFYANPELETIIGPVKGIRCHVSLASATRLTPESAMVILDGLAADPGISQNIVRLNKTLKDRIPAENIAAAQAKGWRISFE